MVYTHEKKKIVETLRRAKQIVVKDMMILFEKSLINEEDNNSFQKTVEDLYDIFLLQITSQVKVNFKSFGRVVEEFIAKEEMELEEFLAKFEKLRLIMEKKILSIQGAEQEKIQLIALLNKFFLDLQKQAYIESITQKERDIVDKDNQLSELTKERTEILAKLSMSFAHEIRNPLTSIKGFVQLLEKRCDFSEKKKYFDFIYQDMEDLEGQVSQLLLLSKEKNHQDVHFSKLNLNDLLYDAVNEFQYTFSEHNIYVDLDLVENIYTNGLEDQVRLILYKLIQNALDALLLKGQQRMLRIKLTKQQEEAVVIISNNGPPIPSMIRKTIFEPFVGTKELGKGLGLAVSKQVMKKHKGDIDYMSNEEWTIFKLRFPIEVSSLKN
ncbi:sensor histidine kinase [Salipaludibacillus daqingensis]|uniref:sensor histidine kinase n=1 Tax=Salipaludibacillus daqingensis TaxID=3041001 RepID=UPI0024772BB5|nr:HAMP domain-containing sensor histidine kinase [Salipaludibacillus daqingensis]